jgi:hypothetical protein
MIELIKYALHLSLSLPLGWLTGPGRGRLLHFVGSNPRQT